MVGAASHFLLGAAILATAVNAQVAVWGQCVSYFSSQSLNTGRFLMVMA